MKFKTKRRLRIILDYAVGWTLAFLFLSIVRGVGTIEISSVQFNFKDSALISLVYGPLFGVISGIIQIITEEYFYKKVSIARLLLFRLLYIVLFIFTLVSISYVMVTEFFGEAKGFLVFAFESGSLPIYLYVVTVDILFLVIRLVNLMLGEHNLIKILRGKFYTPREEHRVFMFLDLQSSVLHAEHLGHINYSKLLQDCFNDLAVVVENEAEIYQYVGDEVILTWKIKAGLRNANCLRAYYNFSKQLNRREAYYRKNYNCKPFFKAGLHAGLVTVTEVGMYKKEIAYHGDTINTAARIQGKCNEYNQGVLVSEYLKSELTDSDYIFTKIGSIPLKGKSKQICLYSATEP